MMSDILTLEVCVGLFLLLILPGILIFLHVRRRGKKGREEEQVSLSGTVGKLHNIGSRGNQQDSFGITSFVGGQFIVVADGMGGLSDGDKISQRVVMTMLQDAAGFQKMPYDRVLFESVAHANSAVNKMIGDAARYMSGSTVVAAIVEKECFHWVSVGDSRIYLYRNGQLMQLNREHTYEMELLVQAVNGEISFQDVQRNPKRNGLTSFIGMGELKYVDGSHKGIGVQKGDRLLLMTDGVFHTLTEEEMCHVMDTSGSAVEAAQNMQRCVLSHEKDNQDNFTAVIMDL